MKTTFAREGSCTNKKKGGRGPPYNLSLQDRPFLRPREGYWKTIEEDFHWHLEILHNSLD